MKNNLKQILLIVFSVFLATSFVHAEEVNKKDAENVVQKEPLHIVVIENLMYLDMGGRHIRSAEYDRLYRFKKAFNDVFKDESERYDFIFHLFPDEPDEDYKGKQLKIVLTEWAMRGPILEHEFWATLLEGEEKHEMGFFSSDYVPTINYGTYAQEKNLINAAKDTMNKMAKKLRPLLAE